MLKLFSKLAVVSQVQVMIYYATFSISSYIDGSRTAGFVGVFLYEKYSLY